MVHSCKALTKPCIYESCLDKHGCVPNQLHYYKDRHGYHAELVLSHFKNESLKGEQRLPLSSSLLEVFALLEQAAVRLKADTLFSLMDGRPYPGPYFSSEMAAMLCWLSWCTQPGQLGSRALYSLASIPMPPLLQPCVLGLFLWATGGQQPTQFGICSAQHGGILLVIPTPNS